MISRLGLVLLVFLPCALGIYVPVGFHGTDNNAKWNMLKGIKTQAAIGTKTSQILGWGTYFGLSPAIANSYAQTRCNERKVKPSTNAGVVIIGVEDEFAKIEKDKSKTPIKSASNDKDQDIVFMDAVRNLVKKCKEKEDAALVKDKNAEFTCKENIDKFTFTAARCPYAEYAVMDEHVVSKNTGGNNDKVVALGWYNVYEINAKDPPAKGAYPIEVYKTKYWVYANINLISAQFKEHQIIDRIRQLFRVSEAACADAKGWMLVKQADAQDAVLAESSSFTRARLKQLKSRQNNQALQP